MTRRSYEYFEVRYKSMTEGATVYHGDENSCRQWIYRHLNDEQVAGKKLYLVRVQVVEVHKPSEE